MKPQFYGIAKNSYVGKHLSLFPQLSDFWGFLGGRIGLISHKAFFLTQYNVYLALLKDTEQKTSSKRSGMEFLLQVTTWDMFWSQEMTRS